MHSAVVPDNAHFFAPRHSLNQLTLLQSLQPKKLSHSCDLSQALSFRSQLQKRPELSQEFDLSAQIILPQKKVKTDQPQYSGRINYSTTSGGPESGLSYFEKEHISHQSLVNLGQLKNFGVNGQTQMNWNHGQQTNGSKSLNRTTSASNVGNSEEDDDDCMIIGESEFKGQKVQEPLVVRDNIFNNIGRVFPVVNSPNAQPIHDREFMRSEYLQQMKAQEIMSHMRNNSRSCDVFNKELVLSSHYSNPQVVNLLKEMQLKPHFQNLHDLQNFANIIRSNTSHALNDLIKSLHSQVENHSEQTKGLVPVITLDDDNDDVETNVPEGSNVSTSLETCQNDEILNESLFTRKHSSPQISDIVVPHTIKTEHDHKELKSDQNMRLNHQYHRKLDRRDSVHFRKNISCGNEEKPSKHIEPSKMNPIHDKSEQDQEEDNGDELMVFETMVGPEFQASIPMYCLNRKRNIPGQRREVKMVWDPKSIERNKLEQFFESLSRITRKEINEEAAIRTLESFDMDIEKTLAVVKRQKNSYRDFFELKQKKS